MVVGACQSFQFFREIAWFLGNNRASDSGAALWIWKKDWQQKNAVIYEDYDSKT